MSARLQVHTFVASLCMLAKLPVALQREAAAGQLFHTNATVAQTLLDYCNSVQIFPQELILEDALIWVQRNSSPVQVIIRPTIRLYVTCRCTKHK